MRTNRCRQLRALLTSYVDDEISAAERRTVDDHLRQCDACRRRVSREEAVHQRLQGWSAEARAQGAPLARPAVLEGRHYSSSTALFGVALLLSATVVVGFVTWSRAWIDTGVPLTARGQISDSRCASGHAHAAAELRSVSRADCVRLCIVRGAQYVFISRGIVYPIRNQDFRELARLAGQDVELEGEVRQKALTVSHVRALTITRSSDELFSTHARAS